jgi:phage portal protein BeeE
VRHASSVRTADLDDLPALAAEREALWSSLERIPLLTRDERRAIAGFSPLTPEPPPLVLRP